MLLVGYAGVHPSVGRGYEFTAITAVVLGGVVLGGGRGWVVAAAAGAFALEALFTLLNFAGVPSTYRDAVQGVIIILAVAYAGDHRSARAVAAAPSRPSSSRRRPATNAPTTSPAPGEGADPSADPARPASIPSTQRADNETKGGS